MPRIVSLAKLMHTHDAKSSPRATNLISSPAQVQPRKSSPPAEATRKKKPAAHRVQMRTVLHLSNVAGGTSSAPTAAAVFEDALKQEV